MRCMADGGAFSYRAVDGVGRRVSGVVVASDEAAAFAELRREGLSPLQLRRARGRVARPRRGPSLGARESADFLGSLADLLGAGADIRTALGILGQRSEGTGVRDASVKLASDIGGGGALDQAFARVFERRFGFVSSLVAAGEAGGDLPGGLRRSADIINARLKMRDQLVSVSAYPAFVFVSAIAAVFVILLFIVPSIAPLAADAGTTPPTSLKILMAASETLRQDGLLIGLGAASVAAAVAAAWATGAFSAPLERLILDGPARRTVRAVVFGSFAITLGAMLAAGAPMTDALRLATRSVRSRGAMRRLEPVIQAVRQGQSLSAALATVKGFPPALVRLAAVGEATNSLGSMLARGGTLEEDTAMRRIESLGRMAGPALIVILGLILGVLMGGLLSGVSQMGQDALL